MRCVWKRIRGCRGMGIVEVLIAALILSIALVGFSQLLVSGLDQETLDIKEHIGMLAATSQVEKLICQIRNGDIAGNAIVTGYTPTDLEGTCSGCMLKWSVKCDTSKENCAIEAGVKLDQTYLAYVQTIKSLEEH